MSVYYDVEVYSSEDGDWAGEGGLSNDDSLGIEYEFAELAVFVGAVRDDLVDLRRRRPGLQVRWFASLRDQTPATALIDAALKAGVDLP